MRTIDLTTDLSVADIVIGDMAMPGNFVFKILSNRAMKDMQIQEMIFLLQEEGWLRSDGFFAIDRSELDELADYATEEGWILGFTEDLFYIESS